MCLGSISPPTCDLSLLAQTKKYHSQVQIVEEEQCGSVGHDGIRRYAHRRVLCKGSEVFVGMWHAIVTSLDMDAETVVIKYTTGGAEEEVPLQAVRSVVFNQLNRDIQVSMSSMLSRFTTVAYDIKKCLTTCSPSYYYYTVTSY